MRFLKQLFTITVMALALASCTLTLPAGAGPADVPGSRTGTSSGIQILGFSFGADASVRSACAQGGITKVATVDTKITNVLYVFIKYETIVTGE